MVSNRMTEGVGKKIVDALKQQSDVEISTQQPQEETVQYDEPILLSETMPPLEFMAEDHQARNEFRNVFDSSVTENLRPSFNVNFNIPEQHKSSVDTSINEFEDFELPANVEVLRQLISKLPSNVSKQTGAQIIKQTMEALGISMKGVLQEAQQVQEGLNASAHECQRNISEYKNQISMLEGQTQKLQRQYAQLNDIISLFIQAVD